MPCSPTLNLKAKIGSSKFVVDWLIEKLNLFDIEFKEKFATKTLSEVRSESISAGKGYSSIVFRVSCFFDDDYVHRVVLKFPTTDISGNGTENLDTLRRLAKVHDVECKFFTQVAPTLSGVPLPVIFCHQALIVGEQEGCVLMEDLSLHGVVPGMFDVTDDAHLKAEICFLAHLHAECWQHRSCWEGEFLENQKLWSDSAPIFVKMVEGFRSYFKDESDPIHDALAVVEPLVGNSDFIFWNTANAHKELALPSVFVHGNFWNANLVFRKHLSKPDRFSSELIAVIDWQTAHEGSPAFDLAHILAICGETRFRRAAEQWVFDYYLDCLSKTTLDTKDIPFTATQLRQAYQRHQVFLAILYIAFTPVVFADLSRDPSTEQERKLELLAKARGMFVDAAALLRGELQASLRRFLPAHDLLSECE